MNLAALIAGALLAFSATDLLRLDETPVGEELPAGWKIRPVSGVPSPRFSVIESAGRAVLHVEGTGAAAWAYRVLDSPIRGGNGILRWSWRVLDLPSGADLRVPAKDDAALRLYVVFGRPGVFGARSRIIFYTWGNTEPRGLSLQSTVSPKFRIVRVAGSMEVGREWREQEVEPFEDYRRFWGDGFPPITAIGLMQDTDMTGEMAVSELRSLVWEAR